MANDDTPREAQKQRTLDALERRLKAELELQQSNINNATPDIHIRNHSSSAKSSSFKKGNFTFVGHLGSEDFDKNSSTYLNLSQSVHENLITFTPNSTSRKKESKVDSILHDLFQNGDGSHKYKQGSRIIKIDNCILLENYAKGPSICTGSKFRALRIHSKRSKKHLTMKQLKRIGALDMPQECHKYELYRPMHETWKNTMSQLVKKHGENHLAQHFLDADLQGALVLVVECNVNSFAGVSGVVIRETAETFGIITKDDKFRVVPKKFSVFVFQFDTWKITLFGDKLSSRNTTLYAGQ